MKIRELRTKDTFALARILRKLDMKQLTTMLAEATEKEKARNKSNKGNVKSDGVSDSLAESVGIQLVGLIVDRLGDVEADLMAFLGDLTGMTAEAFAEQPLGVLQEVLTQLVAAPQVASFFDSMRRAKT